ncbi:hypothetical protein PY093_13560 [Cytobacillus sp. S13-E01]|uniref:hypothetical protein n=1 Tax=Cytobacillus sp. S13-E01 TaxID=3031326 RepID=UPI0023D84E94|nr:hypothetical protein [Cytobacillus sp. S13-E01]MDF0727703.1 hypothetical protein [Cytobacillus sp. S13-E01]
MTGAEIFMGFIGIIIIILLISPFFTKKNGTVEMTEEDFQDEKEQVFMQLSELEYDFQMGKLSEKDYTNTKNELNLKASRFVSQSKENIMDRDLDRLVDNEIRQVLEKNGVIIHEK